MKIEQIEKYRRLGLNIAYYRKIKGLSQSQLAELLDISRTHMSRIETADCAVSLDVVFDICDVLGITPTACSTSPNSERITLFNFSLSRQKKSFFNSERML